MYSDGQQVATASQYVAAAEQIATNIPATKNPDWMPLGVFAMTQDGQASGPTPTMFLQLNVSKEGIIAGSVQNTASNTTQPIEGMVDKTTQGWRNRRNSSLGYSRIPVCPKSRSSAISKPQRIASNLRNERVRGQGKRLSKKSRKQQPIASSPSLQSQPTWEELDAMGICLRDKCPRE